MHFADQRSLFSLELRPECLRHEMGTCLGPCAGQCTRTQYSAQLRAARTFLDGTDPVPLKQLEHQLHEASERCQYERAASIRDRLERLQYLFDRLALLREPPLPTEFVYSVDIGDRQIWYLVAAARVVTVMPTPHNGVAADKCLQRLQQVFSTVGGSELAADRPARQIVAAWFRSNSDQLNSIFAPDEAEQFCRRLLTG